jgi:hypothetical protein
VLNVFTDELIREIISLGTFKQLEEFSVMDNKPGSLTKEGLKLLIGHCPLLKRIEGLSNCPDFNTFLIDDPKRQILKQNFDLLANKSGNQSEPRRIFSDAAPGVRDIMFKFYFPTLQKTHCHPITNTTVLMTLEVKLFAYSQNVSR